MVLREVLISIKCHPKAQSAAACAPGLSGMEWQGMEEQRTDSLHPWYFFDSFAL